MLLTKEKVKAVPYLPLVDEEYKAIKTERVRSMVAGDRVGIAICFVYMAATLVRGFKEEN